MGVLACNLLHVLRQWYLLGEDGKESMEWLTNRLIKVGAKVAYHGPTWQVRVASAPPLDSILPSSVCMKSMDVKMIDGVHCGEVRSKVGDQRLFQDSAALAGVECSGGEMRDLLRSGEPASGFLGKHRRISKNPA
jgi:hypothetical protein